MTGSLHVQGHILSDSYGSFVGGISVGGGNPFGGIDSGEANLTFGSASPGACVRQTVSVGGASTSNSGIFCSPLADVGDGLSMEPPFVSTSGTVTVGLCNNTSSPIVVANATWKCVVMRNF